MIIMGFINQLYVLTSNIKCTQTCFQHSINKLENKQHIFFHGESVMNIISCVTFKESACVRVCACVCQIRVCVSVRCLCMCVCVCVLSACVRVYVCVKYECLRVCVLSECVCVCAVNSDVQFLASSFANT